MQVIAVYNCTGLLTESTVSDATSELRLLFYAYRHQWSQLMRSSKGGVYKLSFVCWCSAREDYDTLVNFAGIILFLNIVSSYRVSFAHLL
jgi:hypothetical protein